MATATIVTAGMAGYGYNSHPSYGYNSYSSYGYSSYGYGHRSYGYGYGRRYW